MDSRIIEFRPGERPSRAATFMVCAATSLGLVIASFVRTGELFVFLAVVLLALATAAVVGGSVTAIRLFGDEGQESGTARRAGSIPHAQVHATHG